MTAFATTPASSLVIPAKAGIQPESASASGAAWIPAFAGMTKKCG
jgi:hypothetical protein